MDWDVWVRTIASVATPIAVLVAARELQFSQRQARSTFEEALNREYREITAELPLDAFAIAPDLHTQLTRSEKVAMFRYFHLSDEQLRLSRIPGRISQETSIAWRQGITRNMALPRFQCEFATLRQSLPPGFLVVLGTTTP